MNPGYVLRYFLMTAAAVIGTGSGLTYGNPAPRAQSDVEEEVEVLTRGPVHEAFAETVTFDPMPGIIVSKTPPEAIEELPPEQRPEGDNVAWIPGYSAWDDERDDFLWISGIWRDLPPGRQWMPGYWSETEGGYQWISGYWADATLSEVQYLPEPPATIEIGPNIDAPSADYNWLPGCWIWHQDRYAWRPGYWAQVQPDWDWVPAHYVWCPRGYVFVDGYNDYSVARRGVLFAPVYLNAGIYARRDYRYSPSAVINLGHFTAHLFSRPSYNHYYFGDYYAANYSTSGYYPWFSYSSSGYGYDPFYARQRWQHRQDPEWGRRIERDFGNRRDNENSRPPRTLAAQISRRKNAVDSEDQSNHLAMRLEELTTSTENKQRFLKIENDERQRLGERQTEIRKFRNERQQLETKAKGTASSVKDPDKPLVVDRVKRPTSPILAKSDTTPETGTTFPKPHEAPDLDLKVEPKPRVGSKSKPVPQTSKNKSKLPAGKEKPSTQSGKKKDSPSVDPSPGEKMSPKPDRPKVDPKPDRPKVDPKPDRPKVDPKPDRPKVDPKPDRPKVDPKPDRPKVDPKPDRPKVDPKPDRPKVDPKPDRPKVDPKPDRPKVDPKPDRPKVDPPKVDPKP